MNPIQEGRVVIVGSGLIGCSWAMVFASGGFEVKLYDIMEEQVVKALEKIGKQLKELEKTGMLKGSLKADQQLALISCSTDLKAAVEGAVYIQECTPENLELKKKIFGELDSIVSNDVILSSSTSCLLPTKLFTGLKHVKQCLVAHPVNPPYYVPLVELVPHPQTDPSTVDITYALMKKIGQSPVKLTKEIDGFALNRLQYAIISESWRLVGKYLESTILTAAVSPSAVSLDKMRAGLVHEGINHKDGVISPDDLDLVMSDGLGMRYAFMGPLETMHLNAEGLLNYCERYREGIIHVLKTFGPIPDFAGETEQKINKAMCKEIPADPEHLNARSHWRDECLLRLAKVKKEMKFGKHHL